MAYGGRGREWHPKFIEYMDCIVSNQNYEGMPCVFKADGAEYDWTIPSFRAEGSQNWDGNHQRRAWWRAKADQLGIEQSGKWISKVAKTIHPGVKPCQVCGREMLIAYAYPQSRIIEKLNDGLPGDDQLHHHDLLTIWEVVQRLRVTLDSDSAASRLLIHAIPKLKEHLGQDPGLDEIVAVITNELVPNEYRGFSPGAMANPPDRLDGFHTYNLCCRSKQDTGRSKENLRSYGVDRRAFEQWAEGDWGLANRLMSVIGAQAGTCAHSGSTCASPVPTSLSADHIGPISLGFKHAAAFALLCRSCNSAKNNRMSLQDVTWLVELERMRHWSAASWHARPLWESLRGRVGSDDDALLMSKCLRTNQHIFLTALSTVVDAGSGGALTPLLNLVPAESRIEIQPEILNQFVNLHIVHLMGGDYERIPRQVSYSESLKGRLIRIAFDSLDGYGRKATRNVRLDEAVALGGLDLQGELEALAGLAASQVDVHLASFHEDLREEDPDKRESAFRARVVDGGLLELERPALIAGIQRFQIRVAVALERVFGERRPIESDLE